MNRIFTLMIIGILCLSIVWVLPSKVKAEQGLEAIVNGGFESGDLSGWSKMGNYPGSVSVVTTDPHSGQYCLCVHGLAMGYQHFQGIPASSVQSITYCERTEAPPMMNMPIDLYYSDSTWEEIREYVTTSWSLFDVTPHLTGKVLVGIGLPGMELNGTAVNTYYDDVSILYSAGAPAFPWVGIKVNVYPNAPTVQYVNSSDYFYVAHGFASLDNWSSLTQDTQNAFLNPQQTNFTWETNASNFQNPPLIQFTYYDSAADVMSSMFWFQFHPGDLAPGAYSFTGTWSMAATANPPNYTAIYMQNTITLIVTIVTLNFPPGQSIESVSVTEYTNVTSPYPPLPGAIGPICNITASGFEGNVTVGIHYDPSLVSTPSKLVIAQFDFLHGDVNHDGNVTLADLVAIAKAYGSKPGDINWNPNTDIDGNGIVGLSDLVAMAHNYGLTAEWIDRPTTVDTANNFVYCTTDHFSGIGIHQLS